MSRGGLSLSEQAALSLVVLISGGGSNLQALIDHRKSGVQPYEIRRVISNRPGVAGLERARRAAIVTRVVDHREFKQREGFERALSSAIDEAAADLVVLAGFMRILGEDFVRRYAGRMINLHPSLLPKYRGLHTHQRALDAADREHGASIHFVTPELDGGPVIAQAHVPVLAGDDAQVLARRLSSEEHRLLVAVTALFAQRRLSCQGGQVLFDRHPLAQPMRLDDDLPSIDQQRAAD